MNGPHEQPAIERATHEVIHDLNAAITHEHQDNHVPIPEREFRRIIAGYLARQTEQELRELLGVPSDPE